MTLYIQHMKYNKDMNTNFYFIHEIIIIILLITAGVFCVLLLSTSS